MNRNWEHLQQRFNFKNTTTARLDKTIHLLYEAAHLHASRATKKKALWKHTNAFPSDPNSGTLFDEKKNMCNWFGLITAQYGNPYALQHSNKFLKYSEIKIFDLWFEPVISHLVSQYSTYWTSTITYFCLQRFILTHAIAALEVGSGNYIHNRQNNTSNIVILQNVVLRNAPFFVYLSNFNRQHYTKHQSAQKKTRFLITL